MIFQPIFVVVPLIALGLVAGIIFGITRWKQPAGKAITIIAGLLLLALLAFVSIVALLAWSSDRGHPM
ncbi:MAG: hypothetical protein RL514_1533 [Verrucomicrobiota bacterium]|jgi:phosphoglycerol transferase MdoB-like AlkP superfamily enzyme